MKTNVKYSAPISEVVELKLEERFCLSGSGGQAKEVQLDYPELTQQIWDN